MAAGGYKEFVAGETLDQDEINDFLMQGMLVFAGTAARGSAIGTPVEGQFSFLKDSDTVEFYDGSAWVPFESGLTYATIGTAATGSFTDGGIDYDYWKFTGNGSLVIDEDGLLDILVVGGGGGNGSSGATGAGGGGGVRYGTFPVTAGTVTITVGAAGSSGSPKGTQGSGSEFGSYLFAGGGGAGYGNNSGVAWSETGAGGGGSPGGVSVAQGFRNGGGAAGSLGATNTYDGLSLNFDGSTVEYGRGGYSGSTSITNAGSGGAPPSAGVVIVKVRT